MTQSTETDGKKKVAPLTTIDSMLRFAAMLLSKIKMRKIYFIEKIILSLCLIDTMIIKTYHHEQKNLNHS
jgi:hypothetical protein